MLNISDRAIDEAILNNSGPLPAAGRALRKVGMDHSPTPFTARAYFGRKLPGFPAVEGRIFCPL